MKLRRLSLIGLALIGVLGLAGAACVTWVVATESGARFVVARVLALTGGSVAVGETAGSFRSEVELSGLRVTGSGFEVEVERVSVDLSLAALVRGSVDIESLSSSVVRVRLSDDGSAAPVADGGQRAAFELPVPIRVRRASFEGFEIDAGADPLVVDRVFLSARADRQSAEVQRLEAWWQDMFVSTQGELDWRDGFAFDTLVSWSGDFDGELLQGSADLNGLWPMVEAEAELLEPMALTAGGSARITEAPVFDLWIREPDVGEVSISGGFDEGQNVWRASILADSIDPERWLADGPDELSIDGEVLLSLGDAIRVATDDFGIEAVVGAETLTGEFAGAYESSGMLEIDSLSLAFRSNRVELTGSIGESADLLLDAEFNELAAFSSLVEGSRFATPELVDFASALSGRAGAELMLTGNPLNPNVGGSVTVEDAGFSGLPMTAILDFTATGADAADDAIEIRRFDASLGTSRIEAAGRIGLGLTGSGGLIGTPPGDALADADIDMDLNLATDSLEEFADLLVRLDVVALAGASAALDEVAGAATASLMVTGSLGRPDIDGRVVATSLSYGDRAISRIELASRLGLYTGAGADLAVDVETDAWTASLEVDGSIDDGEWSGNLVSFVLDEQLLGAWQLASPVPLTLAPGRGSLTEACLTNGGSRICVEGSFGSQADRIRISSTDFELTALNPLLPPSLALTGRVTADASLEYVSDRPVGALSARGQDIGVAVELSETEGVTTLLNSVALDAELDGVALALDAVVQSTTRGRAELALETSDLTDGNSPISGRVDIVWPDLAAAALLSPEIGQVAGRLEIFVDVVGTLDSPEFAGSAALEAGSVSVPEWGVVVDRITAEATSFDGGSVEFSGNGFVADGEVRLSGQTALDPAGGWPTELSLTGDGVPVVQRPDATVYASPELDIRILLPEIEVTGSVMIPEATIAVEGVPPQAVRVSADSVVHGSAVAETARPLEVRADVTVELGEDVSYTGSGLDADLSGGLRLSYESGVSPTASGTVSLAGSYEAYGQSLSLERGELLFAGPLDDPAIDVLAIREIGTTTVGVRLSGTLSAPQPSLFSDPPMSEANALSYLILGRPLSASNDEEAATLQSTALALGLQQALPVVQRVGETLGLDELSIETTDLDAGALMAGKYLSPKLYMSYTYGLFNRLGGFLLRYNINERFSLETRSGDEKSMDLLYSIEKN